MYQKNLSSVPFGSLDCLKNLQDLPPHQWVTLQYKCFC